jgi:hypothetical protein
LRGDHFRIKLGGHQVLGENKRKWARVTNLAPIGQNPNKMSWKLARVERKTRLPRLRDKRGRRILQRREASVESSKTWRSVWSGSVESGKTWRSVWSGRAQGGRKRGGGIRRVRMHSRVKTRVLRTLWRQCSPKPSCLRYVAIWAVFRETPFRRLKSTTNAGCGGVGARSCLSSAPSFGSMAVLILPFRGRGTPSRRRGGL